MSFKLFLVLSRYIDQYQELLDAPATVAERKDLEIYALAVQTAKGEGRDYWEEDIPRDFIAYVERSSNRHLDGAEMTGTFHVSYNYERWLGSSSG